MAKKFLSGRKQKVVVNGQSSSWCDVRSGVPQGSVLGPLLFNVYINDITTQISSPILQFADDLKMFHIINDATDYHQQWRIQDGAFRANAPPPPPPPLTSHLVEKLAIATSE